MKVSLVAAVTQDGFIARSHDELANWSSGVDKKFFVQITKEAGVMIMGSTTYDTIGRPLPGRKTVIYTSQPGKYKGVDVMTTRAKPATLLKRLAAEGYEHVTICGGSVIYNMFMQAGLVTDLYITIEPVTFGEGIPLFAPETHLSLKLIDTQQLTPEVALMHYRVNNEVDPS